MVSVSNCGLIPMASTICLIRSALKSMNTSVSLSGERGEGEGGRVEGKLKYEYRYCWWHYLYSSLSPLLTMHPCSPHTPPPSYPHIHHPSTLLPSPYTLHHTPLHPPTSYESLSVQDEGFHELICLPLLPLPLVTLLHFL